MEKGPKAHLPLRSCSALSQDRALLFTRLCPCECLLKQRGFDLGITVSIRKHFHLTLGVVPALLEYVDEHLVALSQKGREKSMSNCELLNETGGALVREEAHLNPILVTSQLVPMLCR